MQLKHTNYYWVDAERVQFKAEIGTSSFFKVPVAKFIWPMVKLFQFQWNHLQMN